MGKPVRDGAGPRGERTDAPGPGGITDGELGAAAAPGAGGGSAAVSPVRGRDAGGVGGDRAAGGGPDPEARGAGRWPRPVRGAGAAGGAGRAPELIPVPCRSATTGPAGRGGVGGFGGRGRDGRRELRPGPHPAAKSLVPIPGVLEVHFPGSSDDPDRLPTSAPAPGGLHTMSYAFGSRSTRSVRGI